MYLKYKPETIYKLKKLIIIFFVVGFVATACFIFYTAKNMFFKKQQTESPQILAAQAYYKKHSKQVKEKFVVDSISYTVIDFTYNRNIDSVILFVNLLLQNPTNEVKKYTDSFFVLKAGLSKKYYPTLNGNVVLQKQIQWLKIRYKVPSTGLPYESYDLHITGAKDSSQNAVINFHQNFSEGG